VCIYTYIYKYIYIYIYIYIKRLISLGGVGRDVFLNRNAWDNRIAWDKPSISLIWSREIHPLRMRRRELA